MIQLAELLEYRNKNVLDRYCKDYSTTKELAEERFVEMLKYLWLSVKNDIEYEKDPDSRAYVYMHPEMVDIDNVWHTFLLFTRDYTDFCVKYFGEYLHHQPKTEDETVLSKEEADRQFEKYLNYICDNLGENTLRIWFAQYV